jgi:hypothetical protein
MALTDIELVYAEAADLIGEIEINESSSHTTKPYSTCARHYENAKNEMIRGYAWNEATEPTLCLQDGTTPVHSWTYRFPLPGDCLRPLHTSRPREDWRVMGGYAYTDYKISPAAYTVGKEYKTDQYLSVDGITYLIQNNFTATNWATDISYCTTKNADYGYIELEYVKELDDPNDWSVNLRQAIVLNLACKIVVPITSDTKRRVTMLEELHQLVLPHSMWVDAMQGKPKQQFYSDWIDSRE